ncbi:Cytochrome P450 3A11 [Tolypocladium ophioglossoides CBS 100239]|uniref:Cytochrome P450 3A11 n=1 Tax=Tolypocladium ophioglossoides (strain CBS 100239) TaxID=1163406 RepID=A0A0L0NKF4_TOLOC|nr:Cytochrome P450 3A11 [Tolypocladium ophioglossoides CBS 100239]
MILTLLLTSALAYVLWSLACLESNVRKARAIGVPVVRLPIDVHNVPWVAFQPLVWSLLDRLPIPWSCYPDCVRFARRGWHFTDRSDTHVRLGPVWALVTPAAVHLHFADPDAIRDIFARRQDFVRPIKDYKLLEIFGPCISTAGWDDWARHRKPLAAPFNESIMMFVWDESLQQAGAMLRSWTGDSAVAAGIPSVQKDTRTLSLNVLAATGFSKSYDFHGSADGPVVDGDEAGSYRDALQTVLDGAILLILVPLRYLGAPMMPKSWAKIGRAARVFKQYMEQMLQDETTALSQGRPGSGGIITPFVHALAEHNLHPEAQNAKDSKSGKRGLAIDEIYSNLFVINFAGHDTTANTLAFTMFLLAAHPEVQAWIAEEIATVTKDLSVGEWDYKTLFPQLKRCRAVLLETLRLYPPIMALPKWTSERAQTLRVGAQTLVIPPGTSTSPYLLAIQTHPKYWKDPYVWQPSRWISNPAASPDAMADEDVVVPLKGTYFPWSDGPQNCPGKKFAEVEAVAVLARLFKTHRLLAKKYDGESDESARKRALACANDVDMEMLLRMVDAGRARLICTEA